MNSEVFILGNCALDNKETYFETAEYLYNLMDGKDWYLKVSFDKANRTSIKGKRGLGLSSAISIFHEVKDMCPGIKLTTDVHECWQVEKLVDVMNLIQVPSFLGRQTDLIVECAKYFDKVNIKKGQHLGPNNLIKSVDKVKETNPAAEVWLTDRGTSLGYDHLIVDFTIIEEIKKYYDRFILDCTHATQRSRKTYLVQGDPELAKRYFLISKIMGYNGVFAETHPRPWESASDGDCMIKLSEMKKLLKNYERCNSTAKLCSCPPKKKCQEKKNVTSPVY